MFTIDAANVNDALALGTRLLEDHGVQESSRNGPVLVAPEPVVTVYNYPWQRVLFLAERDHNPFFAFFETLWMFAGRDDLETLLPFNKNMAQFSDDGVYIRGSAYGCRWRRWFGYDQLEDLVHHLQADPRSRRAVLTMWDARTDPRVSSKDLPCNLQVLFRLNTYAGTDRERLDMTVFNRSNDIVWGAYGSNAVHFSMLQEYVAGRLGVGIGKYYQFSNNFHGYVENPVYQRVREFYRHILIPNSNVYASLRQLSFTYPMFSQGVSPKLWDTDVKAIWAGEEDESKFNHSFFPEVALPLLRAHKAWRDRSDPRRFSKAKYWLYDCLAPDWRLAAWQWVNRRQRRAK